VRNQWLYGDPLGWRMFLDIHRHMVRSGPYTWGVFTEDFLGQIGRTFWGAFGYMHITFPQLASYLWWLSGLAGVGLVVGLVRDRSAARALWPAWLVALATLLLLLASFVRFSMATVGAGHGRYLFPAGLTIGALLIAGLNGFLNWRHQRWVTVTVFAGMLVYSVWLPWNHVLPKYASPETASGEDLAQVQLVERPLAEGVELVGYRTGDDRASPGEWLPVSLYWRATGEPVGRQDPRILLQLVDQSGNAVSSHTLWPVASMPPSVWQADAVYVTQTSLGLPDGQLPQELSLTVTPLLNSPQAGGEPVYLARLVTTGGIEEVTLEHVPLNREETFAAVLRLLGYELSPDAVRPGDSLAVSLYWSVLEPPAGDYTVFIHLLDENGDLITQFDRPAGGDMTPTSTWAVGQVLRDTYPLSIPQDATGGSYTLRMGMYLWPSMERLPVSTKGRLAENDFIDLGTVQVRP
jgi:hypothetical protein